MTWRREGGGEGLDPGTEVFIQPRRVGTMVKLLTPEQIAGARDD